MLFSFSSGLSPGFGGSAEYLADAKGRSRRSTIFWDDSLVGSTHAVVRLYPGLWRPAHPDPGTLLQRRRLVPGFKLAGIGPRDIDVTGDAGRGGRRFLRHRHCRSAPAGLLAGRLRHQLVALLRFRHARPCRQRYSRLRPAATAAAVLHPATIWRFARRRASASAGNRLSVRSRSTWVYRSSKRLMIGPKSSTSAPGQGFKSMTMKSLTARTILVAGLLVLGVVGPNAALAAAAATGGTAPLREGSTYRLRRVLRDSKVGQDMQQASQSASSAKPRTN